MKPVDKAKSVNFDLAEMPESAQLSVLADLVPGLDIQALESFLLLRRIMGELRSRMESRLLQHQLSAGRLTLLGILFRTPHHRLSPSELAEKCGVTRATVSGLLQGLEKSGLVARSHDTADKRSHRVELTPKAHKLLKKTLPGHFREMQSLLKVLGSKGAQIFLEDLRKMRQALDAW